MIQSAKELFAHYRTTPELSLRRVIFEKIVESFESRPDDFRTELLNIIFDYLPLKGCAMYSYHPDENRLCLLAQRGFKFEDYEKFEIESPSIATSAAQLGVSQLHTDVRSNPVFKSKALAAKHGLKSAVILPLTTKLLHRFNARIKTLAVISMYPESDEESVVVHRMARELEAFLGSLYYINLQLRLLEIRDKVIKKAYTAADLRSCLYKILQILITDIGVEAGSIFLYDGSGKKLVLQSTTGIDSELSRLSIFYTKKDADCLTWKCFESGQTICIRDIDGGKHTGKYLESVKSSRQCFLAQPIISNDERRDSLGAPIRRIRGVLRILNKRVSYDGIEAVVGFSWEDKIIVEFVSDMIAAIVHMFSSREKRVDFFEQIMHGATTSITACLVNLSFLEKRTDALSRLTAVGGSQYFYLFKDTQTFLHDIRHQVDRLAFNRKAIKGEKVELAGEVLSKTVALFENIANTHGIKNAKITHLKENRFYDLPPVSGDPDALLMVFRNLIENAIRYRNIPSNQCTVVLTHSFDSDSVYIKFSDHGIGIPDEEMDSIFEEGFRAENAVAQYPASTGLGLHQAMDLLHRMKGEIFLVKCSPATFLISLKRYK